MDENVHDCRYEDISGFAGLIGGEKVVERLQGGGG